MKDILLIFLLQLIYVPLNTLRLIFVVKNLSLIASLCGFLEILVYVWGLAIVFDGEQSFLNMIVYAVAYSIGIYMGGYIERKLAVGNTRFSVNMQAKNEDLIHRLREHGFGVTVFEGEGKDSKRYQLEIVAKRKRERELLRLIEEYEPQAFIVTYEPRYSKGGYLHK